MTQSDRAVIFQRFAFAACAALVAAACVAGAGASPSNTPAAPSPIPTPRVLGSLSAPLPPTAAVSTALADTAAPASTSETPAGSTSPIELGEADNGRTISVPVGSTVRLILHNTYWVVHDSSDPSVLAMAGQPVYSGAGTVVCIPGTGCGTVTASFSALAPGSAVVSASRTSCGEALLCVSGAGSFEVTLEVTL